MKKIPYVIFAFALFLFGKLCASGPKEVMLMFCTPSINYIKIKNTNSDFYFDGRSTRKIFSPPSAAEILYNNLQGKKFSAFGGHFS